ncbi:hypothetical protein PCC82_06400 [Agrobacterium deltaense]
MAGITDYLTSKIKGLLTPERWDGFIRALDVRFGVLEEQLGIERRVTESILQRGLQVIEDGIGPAIIQAEKAANNISAIANLGMVFTAPSATTVLIGMGQKSFTVPTNRKDQFAPAAIMMAYAGLDYSNAIIGSTASYNRSTGVLVLDVIETIGSGIFNAWTLTPVATTADLEALRDQVQADRLQAGLNAGAAVNAKNDAQSIATDFRAKYLGTRATDPTTDGNGNPVAIGALYTNAGSGKLRYYGLSGWQDTTAGSNIVRYTFVTDDRGTAPYPLPEAPASKDNCFVIVGNAPLKGSAFNVDGTNFSFVTNPGVGLAVEVKIIAQLAIGIPSDETVDDAKIKTSAIGAILTKLGVYDLLALKANANATAALLALKEDKTVVSTKASNENRHLNPAFQVSQDRNVGTLVDISTPVQYLFDGVCASARGGGVLRSSLAAKTSGDGSLTRPRLVVQTADASLAASDFYDIEFPIEGVDVSDLRFGAANAKPFTWRGVVCLPQGTYGLSFVNGDISRTYVTMFTVTAGEANNDKLISVTVPGDTSGTWVKDTSGTGIRARISFGFGSNFVGASEGAWVAGNFLGTAAQTNAVATVGNTFEVADIGLYEGTELPVWQKPDYGKVLKACRRLFRVCAANVYGTGHGSYGGALANFDISEMRGSPNAQGFTQSNFGGFPTSVSVGIATGNSQKRAYIFPSTTAPSDSGAELIMIVNSRL